MSTPTIAPVRRPPHDPTSLLLDGRSGWQVADTAGVTAAHGVLRLARDPASVRRLTETGGSFGGLRLPAGMACCDEGTIWAVDRDHRRLVRFDPCRCAFVPVRLLGYAGAIAACRDRLFVTDPAGWLHVLALPSTVTGGRWRPPVPWSPVAVVVDGHHQVRVLDTVGRLHTFAWSGRYLGHLTGLGGTCYLGVDTSGIVYAAGDSGSGPAPVFRIDGDSVVPVADDAADLPVPWPPMPPVDRGGVVDIGGCCVPPRTAYIDADGEPVDPPASAAPPPAWLTTGTIVLGPLDSLIGGCTWHRVLIHAQLPELTGFQVWTHTADTPLPTPQLTALPDTAWSGGAVADESGPQGWDTLVNDGSGRYLWLRVRLTGTGAATPRLRRIEVEFPRISLRRHLPAVYGAEPDSASFTDRFLGLFDRQLRDIEDRVDALPALLTPEATPALDWLSDWVGLTLDPRLPERTRRRLLASSARLYDLRGTYTGLRELLSIALGIDQRRPAAQRPHEPGRCRCARETCPPTPLVPSPWAPPRLILEHFRLRRWLRTDASRVGDEARLWGQSIVNRSQLGNGAQVGVTQLKTSQDPLRDPFHVYAHRYTVFVPASAGATPTARRVIQRLVDLGTPAHTAGTVQFVQPRMRLGVQSCLGLDSVVARVPSGFVLGDDGDHGRLGAATVLTGEPGAPPRPPQLGTTTVL
ncbi:phage tail protein [Flexivirga oryzae]|uniref:Phage tail-like protein n=1 Tax=Flexivirga oryzae TaxID=1794944 RepID=A0A839MXV4_9MICO|nr:phage tail protein [Flexivirga oryzae]MBB2890228.1 phage tail-like protein [Flexivirga oryzae]